MKKERTFHLQSVHCNWLVNNPENGWTSLDKVGVAGMAQSELQGLASLSPLQSNVAIGMISEDRARIMPGLMWFVDTLVMDWDNILALPLQCLSIPLALVSLCEISMHDTLRKPKRSPQSFMSATGEVAGKASDKQPFCKYIVNI